MFHFQGNYQVRERKLKYTIDIYIYVCIHVCAKKNVHGKEFKVLKFTGSILSTETVLNIVANLGNLESLKLQILTSDCKNIQFISGHSADVTCLHVSF